MLFRSLSGNLIVLRVISESASVAEHFGCYATQAILVGLCGESLVRCSDDVNDLIVDALDFPFRVPLCTRCLGVELTFGRFFRRIGIVTAG